MVLTVLLGAWCAEGISAGGHFLQYRPVAGMTVADTSQGTTPLRPVLATGVLLIAGKNLRDPNFARTVVLLTDYGNEGAIGLVLNRSTTLPVSSAMPQVEGLVPGLDEIYIGGPVAANHIRLLVEGNNVPEGAKQVVDNIFMIDTIEALRQLGTENRRQGGIRLYMGYAGWMPGQLEMELLHGDWLLWPAGSEIIFSKHPESIWHELVYLASAKWT